MITPTNATIQPSITYTGIWVKNISIVAASPNSPMQATIQISPYDPISGLVSPILKQIFIPDIVAISQGTSASSMYVSQSMINIFGYIQHQVISQSLF